MSVPRQSLGTRNAVSCQKQNYTLITYCIAAQEHPGATPLK
jgi:hypothetical protein